MPEEGVIIIFTTSFLVLVYEGMGLIIFSKFFNFDEDRLEPLLTSMLLFWPIILPAIGIMKMLKKLNSWRISHREKLGQSFEPPPVDVLAVERENEELLNKYHANMVRISEMEFAEMKRLS